MVVTTRTPKWNTTQRAFQLSVTVTHAIRHELQDGPEKARSDLLLIKVRWAEITKGGYRVIVFALVPPGRRKMSAARNIGPNGFSPALSTQRVRLTVQPLGSRSQDRVRDRGSRAVASGPDTLDLITKPRPGKER